MKGEIVKRVSMGKGALFMVYPQKVCPQEVCPREVYPREVCLVKSSQAKIFLI